MADRSLFELVWDQFFTTVATKIRSRARRNGDFRNIVVPIDDVIGMRVFATGRWEFTLLDGIRDLLIKSSGQTKKLGVFLDVGANIGLFSVALAKFFEATLAFEANPTTYKILEANIALSGAPNVRCINLGVSSKAGTATLHSPQDNLGWATLNPSRHTEAIQTQIKLDTLDNLVQGAGLGPYPVSLLKVDVEGHEAEVLSGARGTLQRWNPIVLFEVLDGEAGARSLAILKDCGYGRYCTFHRSRSLSAPVVLKDYDSSNPQSAGLVCAMK